MIKVKANLYATLRKYRPDVPPWEPLLLEVAEGTTLSELLGQLGIPVSEIKVVFVNNLQQELSYSLKSGDRLHIFPPIAGG